MSKVNGLVEIHCIDASRAALETIEQIKKHREERFEQAITREMTKPVKVGFVDLLFGFTTRATSREQAVERLKSSDGDFFGSVYGHIQTYFSDLESECNTIIAASKQQGAEKMYLPIKTVAYFHEFGKQ